MLSRPGNARLAAACLVAVLGCSARPPASAPPPAASIEVVVPAGDAPIIDGRAGEGEWARAAVIALDRGGQLRLVHDGEKVYLGVSGLPPGAFGCVFVSGPDRIGVLHASAQLGVATYTRAADGSYEPRSKTYDWRDPAAMLAAEGWHASTVGPDSRHQELALAFATLGLPAAAHPIALGYLVLPPGATDLSGASTVAWPSGLVDAVTDPQLLAGFNPDGVAFDPARWARLRLE